MAMVYIPTRDIEHLVQFFHQSDTLEDVELSQDAYEIRERTIQVHKATLKLNMAYRHIGQNVGKQFHKTKYITMSETKEMQDE